MNLVEKELKRFTNIVQNHVHNLQSFEEYLEVDDTTACQKNNILLSFKFSSLEPVDDAELINTDNTILDKTIKILFTVCKETILLSDQAEKELYFPLLQYGQEENSSKGSALEILSNFLPVLEQVATFIQQVEDISLNILLQMNALYPSEKKTNLTHAGEAHFQVVFEHFCHLLATLILLDEIISQNTRLNLDLKSYHSLIIRLKDDPVCAFDSQDILNLESIIKYILDKTKPSIFKNTLIRLSHKCQTNLENNKRLQDEIQTILFGWSSKVEEISVDNWSENIEDQVVSLTVLALFLHTVFDISAHKVAKDLIILFKKVPCCMTVVGHALIGEKYIETHFPEFFFLFERKDLESLNSYRCNYLTNKTQSIVNEVHINSFKVYEWSLRMETANKFPSKLLTTKELSIQASLLAQGLSYASYLKFLVESIVGLHAFQGSPISKTCVTSICQLLEVLQAIQIAYCINASMYVEIFPHLRQHFGYQILSFLKNFKKQASSFEKLNSHQLDLLAAIKVAEQTLYSNATKPRRLLARISLSLLTQHNILSNKDLSTLSMLMKHLELIDELEVKVMKVTESNFIFHHHVLLSSYLQECYNSFPNHSHRIQFLMSAIESSEKKLQNGKFAIEKSVDIFKKEFVDKLCKCLENELRLSTHKHLHLDGQNPYDAPVKVLKPLLNIPLLKISGSEFNVKLYVEQYLERTFYGLTVLAPHNACAYEKMRDFAASSFEIVTTESSLPAQDLEQGVDVLEIMRNIEVFVQRYQYNLNQQFFIENVDDIESENKYLNVVSLKQIANSIRTHGTGIIHTTVNFTYQYLIKKFHILSQFLFDEHIKSRLLRDLQYWKEVSLSVDEFPFLRAEKFHKGIRKLGVSSKGLTYLDQFRKLISQIGNAIGFVRLVRSGGLHLVSSTTQFIPCLETLPSFKSCCSTRDDSSYQASLLLDDVTTNLNTYFNLETDFLKILVDAFSSLRDVKNSHLYNFFLIVPPLTINFVDYMMLLRGKMKNKSISANFTDDGFVIGLSYILKVFEQEASFSSLHWMTGVRKKLMSDRDLVKKEIVKVADEKLKQTLALSLSRIEQQMIEFDLLFLGLSSSRVFFNG